MITQQGVVELYAFDRWACAGILKAVSELSEEEYGRHLGSSFGGIRGALVHSLGADRIWLERWRGDRSSPFATEEEFPDLATLWRAWLRLHEEVEEFVGSLSEERLQQVVNYRDTKGNSFSDPLWQLLLHRVNHSTYHRGQVAGMLRQLGRQAPATDLVVFFRSLIR